MHRLSFLALASVLVVQVLAASGPVAGGFVYLGCYTDSTDGRALNDMALNADNTTVEYCLAACAQAQQGQGFSFAGLEFGRECWCGSQLENGSELSVNGGCNMPCAGNSNETCGGPNRLDLYFNQALIAIGPTVVPSS